MNMQGNKLGNLLEQVNNFIANVNKLESNQQASIQLRERLEKSIQDLISQARLDNEELEIVTNAISILREVSDEAVQKSYEFIQDSLNATLERIFNKTVRKIRLKEYTRGEQYPQLVIELTVENGKVRSLKSDSGHGLMQIVSLLCILTIIVITNERRILVIDEVLSGLSRNSRRIVSEILWTFTEIGFQFIISEHGFVPCNAKVYHLVMEGGVTHIENEYIEPNGYYLDGTLPESEETISEQEIEKEEESKISWGTEISSKQAEEIKSGHVIEI